MLDSIFVILIGLVGLLTSLVQLRTAIVASKKKRKK